VIICLAAQLNRWGHRPSASHFYVGPPRESAIGGVMRLWCWYCHKSVSSELPDSAIFRAIAVCPECIQASPEAANHPLQHEAAQPGAASDVACMCKVTPAGGIKTSPKCLIHGTQPRA